MPFLSKSQSKWAFATHQEWADKWAKQTDYKNLPMKKLRGKMQKGGQKGMYNLDGSFSPGYYDKKSDSWVSTGDTIPTAKKMIADNPISIQEYNPFGKTPWLSNQKGNNTVSNIPVITPEMSPEEIQKALEDVNNAPGNETQYFQTGWETDMGNGQKTAKPYDGNGTGMTYQEQAHAEANQTAAGAGPGTNPPKPPTKKNSINPFDVFMGLRGAGMAANFLSGIHARNLQDQYDYKQQTSLGQVNPIPVSNFQYTPNHMYAQEGGVMNPYQYHAKYGGNLKSIIRDYKKWSNDAGPMDMTDGDHARYPERRKGGYAIDDMVIKNYITKLFKFGKGPHQYEQTGGLLGTSMLPPAHLPGDTIPQNMITPLSHQLWSNGQNYTSLDTLKTLPFGRQLYNIKPKDIQKIKSKLDDIGWFGRTLDAALPYKDINLQNYEEGGQINQETMILRKGGNPAKRQMSQPQQQQGQQQQIMQVIQAYAQMSGKDPKQIMQALQQMQPQQQQAAIQQMAQAIQQQQGQGQAQQQMSPDQQGMMKKGGNWLKGAVNPDHKGWCTPMSNPHCTGRRRQFALMMKKNHGFHE